MNTVRHNAAEPEESINLSSGFSSSVHIVFEMLL